MLDANAAELGRLMELCEGSEALNQELHAAKVHISAQADEKEQMLRAAAAQLQQLQNAQEELKTERALSKLNQDVACDEVARAREEIRVGCCCQW
jgi:hypothetical protein